MLINHSGWSEKYGSFNYNILFNEKRTDFEIRFESGQSLRQCSEFQHVTADWNCDGDIYTEFGANFTRFDKDGTPRAGREFWTPTDLIVELIDGLYGDDFPSRDRMISISGVNVPPPNKRPSLEDQVARTMRQDMGRDVDRNRRMNALGIRSPEEPWAR